MTGGPLENDRQNRDLSWQKIDKILATGGSPGMVKKCGTGNKILIVPNNSFESAPHSKKW